jgi:outer membrane receptor protein involved in Fe transport
MKKFKILISAICAFLISANANSKDSWDYEVSAKKLQESKNNLSPKTGGSSYNFSQSDINNLPQGQATSLDRVLLRAPGVTKNVRGQFHVRGDHSNVQYRINDVMIPQGINGFSNSFDMHFADSVSLLRGVLPAQYGFKTAGVVDIKTKGGNFDKGARSELLVGENNTLGFNQQLSGYDGGFNYYLSTGISKNERGLPDPNGVRNSVRNEMKQDRVFGYFSKLLDEKKKLSLIVSNSTNRFQIPTIGGAHEENNFPGGLSLNSQDINQSQREESRFAILSLQGITDSEIDYQVSLFSSQNKTKFRSDLVGDIIYNDIATDIDKSSFNNGIQADFSFQASEKNKVTSGLYFNNERVNDDRFNSTLEDGTNNLVSFNTDSNQTTQLYGLYIQDQYKPLEDLTLNFGLRFDSYEGRISESQVSPRFSATYDISSKTKIFGGYARYLSTPRSEMLSSELVEKYRGTIAEPDTFDNGLVKSERSDYFDIGISHKFNDNLAVNLDTYYKKSKNLLDEHQFGHTMIFAPFNFREGRSYGVELGLDYKKDNFDAFINFSAQKVQGRDINSAQYVSHDEDIEDAENDFVYLDHDQRFTASFGFNYNYKGTTLGVDGFHGSGLRTHGGSMPAYIQTNLSISRDFNLPVLEKTNLKFIMLNIFDEEYQLHDGHGIGVKASQFGPRRSMYLMAVKNF